MNLWFASSSPSTASPRRFRLRFTPPDLALAMCFVSLFGLASAIRWPTNFLSTSLAIGITIKKNGFASSPPKPMAALSIGPKLLGSPLDSFSSSAAATLLSLGLITLSTNFRVQSRPCGSLSILAKRFSAGDLEPWRLDSSNQFLTSQMASLAIWSRSSFCT